MPHYRITIKLENKPVQEYLIEDPRNQIDFVYQEYRNRVYKKNGAGRVTYFDLVMLADESVKHLEDRKEVFNETNNFGITNITPSKKQKPNRKDPGPQMTLAERARRSK